MPEGFTVVASTDVCPVAAMENAEKQHLHHAVPPRGQAHRVRPADLLKNFLFGVCELEKNWSMDNLVETMTAEFREKVGEDRVILALSGGVDSSVVAALGARAIGKQMTCVFVNHGLLRKGEPEQVEEVFTKQFDVDFIHVHAEDRYAELLAGVTEPEQKRRIIGTQFWKEFFAVAQQLETDGKPVKYLAQGTIYPDIIESGARKTGGKASHHQEPPQPDPVPRWRAASTSSSRSTTSSRTRSVRWAWRWVCPAHIVYRQPFPGPGLAIRIIGAVDKEKLEILKNADAIVREELDAYNETAFRGDWRAQLRAQLLAILRGAARHQERGRHGRRTHLPAPRSSCAPSRAQRRHDRRLGQAALRGAGRRFPAASWPRSPAPTACATTSRAKPPATIEWE